jgi:hypothetical protein
VTSAVAWFFPAGFLLIGGGMIVLAIKAKRRRARWEAAATSTSGEVTDLRWQSVGQAGDSQLLAFPVLRFSLPDGRTVGTQSSWGTNPPAAKPAAQMTVLYDPADPTSASLPAGGSASVVSGVIFALGVILIAVGLAILRLTGFDLPTGYQIAVVAYILVVGVQSLERLRVDDKGIRVPPFGRIPWERVQSVTCRSPHQLGVKRKPDAPLPRRVRGMVDGEVTLPVRDIELDPGRLDRAVRAYADAGGSFSGRPGNGASSSGMSAGGPSG